MKGIVIGAGGVMLVSTLWVFKTAFTLLGILTAIYLGYKLIGN